MYMAIHYVHMYYVMYYVSICAVKILHKRNNQVIARAVYCSLISPLSFVTDNWTNCEFA